jgi:hypothetical protein
MRAILAAGVIVFAMAASAQTAQNLPVGPDNGFFRPTPGNDPSLTHPPVAAPNPAPPAFLAQEQATAPVAVPVPLQVPVPVQIPVPVATVVQPPVQNAERELDRAEREAEEARRRAAAAPAPIAGAFTGQTSERDR